MTREMKRVYLSLSKAYRDALDYLVDEGIYLDKQEAIRDILRLFFGAQGISPFYSGVEIPEGANGIYVVEEAELPECPRCGGPATHLSGLCRDCHQAKLEAGPP